MTHEPLHLQFLSGCLVSQRAMRERQSQSVTVCEGTCMKHSSSDSMDIDRAVADGMDALVLAVVFGWLVILAKEHLADLAPHTNALFALVYFKAVDNTHKAESKDTAFILTKLVNAINCTLKV